VMEPVARARPTGAPFSAVYSYRWFGSRREHELEQQKRQME